MAQASTIKDFLVALGFKTDNAGLAKMQGAMQGVELKAKSLNAALGALAVGAVLAVRQTASELDKLYFSSKRIGASAENINAYGNAIAQMGGSAEDAIGTLESLAEKMRNSPGYEGMLNSLGVSTKDANGALRDRVEVMKDLSTTLAKMPSYQANAYANSLGIDQKTLLAMRDDKFIGNMEKYQKIQKELGMNDELTKSGNDFMTQYRDLSMITKTGFQVIVMQVGKALIPVMKGLNQLVLMGVHAFSQMNPQIKNILVVGLRFALLSAVFSTVTRTLGLFLRLAAPLKGFIRLLGLLRLAFLATPIGIITALGAAILALYNDYKTWKEGGKSFLDWSQWSKEIDWVSQKIRDFMDLLEKITGKTIEFVQKLIKDPEGTITGVVKDAVEKAKEIAKAAPAVVKEAAKNVVAVAGVTTNGVKGLARASSMHMQNYSSKYFTSEKAEAIKETAARLGINPNDLASVISFETGGTFSPAAKNKNSSATGLIQFMKGSGGTKNKYYGLTRDEFSSLSFTEQMKYVEQYFRERGFKQGKNSSIGDVYGAVTGWGYKKGSSAYDLNKVWDSNKDGVVSKGEMVQNPSFKAHQRNYFSDSISNINNPQIRNYAPPTGNPSKSQINSSKSSSSNVTINQAYNTTMTVNGAKDPQESANAVKRSQDNANTLLARNTRGIMT